jgi:hypothetical protein
VGVARAMPATPVGGTRRNPTGAPGLTAIAWWIASRSPLFPHFPTMTTHLHTARTLHTQPSRLPVPVGRHPGYCLLVTVPSAHHTTPHHTRHITTWYHTTRHHTKLHCHHTALCCTAMHCGLELCCTLLGSSCMFCKPQHGALYQCGI